MADELTEGTPSAPSPPSMKVKRHVIKKRTGRKERQEELEQPDEFMEVGGTVVDWVVENLRSVGLALGVAFAGLGLWAGMQALDAGNRSDAAAALYQALDLMPDEGPAVGALAISTSSDGDAADSAKVAEGLTALDAVIAEYDGTPQADQARLRAAKALFAEGDHERALTYLQDVSSDSGIVATATQSAKAYSLEALGRLDEALALFSTIEQNSVGERKEQSILDQARVHEAQGDYARAREIYTRFEADFPESSSLSEVRAQAAFIAKL